MRRLFLLLVWPLLAWAATPLAAQQAPVTPPAQPAPIDSFEVVGATRVPASYIISATGLVLQQRPSPRDIQRAIAAVYRSGGFDDVRIDATRREREEHPRHHRRRAPAPRELDRRRRRARSPSAPCATRSSSLVNRPVDRVAIAHGQFAIDSLYRNRGYYSATVTVQAITAYDGRVDVTYTIVEGDARRHLDGRDRGREGHLRRQATSSSTWPPSPRASGGGRRAPTTRTCSRATFASACRPGTPRRATSTSRSWTTASSPT